MSAGTIVVSGGILAGAILLCIIAVLCYCRLQYYCCKKNESEMDVGGSAAAEGGSDPLSHFPCNACDALAMDGAAIAPVSLDQLDPGPSPPPCDHCPTCAPPYPLCSELPDEDEVRNGGERLGFHTYYDRPPPSSSSLPATPRGSSSPLSFYASADLFPTLPRPYSTQV